jgi:hypothetical protein
MTKTNTSITMLPRYAQRYQVIPNAKAPRTKALERLDSEPDIFDDCDDHTWESPNDSRLHSHSSLASSVENNSNEYDFRSLSSTNNQSSQRKKSAFEEQEELIRRYCKMDSTVGMGDSDRDMYRAMKNNQPVLVENEFEEAK